MPPISRGDATGSRRWPVRRAESFGGAVVRTEDRRHEVALIRTRNLKGEYVWTLPKGTAEEGEAPMVTALREVEEETGLKAEIIEPLEPITYWFVSSAERARYRKTVHFYLMRAIGGDPANHDHEVEEVRFVPVDEAHGIATYPTDRRILRRIADAVLNW